ncbi:GNAT family N-acetyltransferase [Roseateles sp. LYH14W]|uniref:GNAT family N-acetyltransferase n=1 Tax=Pelomonas parva TaxID=3299032 RepID=A0ABW7F5G2_9BURK
MAVCRVGFGVSPLDNEIYVDDLEVHPSLRRHGLARLLLKVVVERCSPPGKPLPIAPLQASADSAPFWSALCEDCEPGLVIAPPMRRCEMRLAAQHWEDLADCSNELARYVRNRKADVRVAGISAVPGEHLGPMRHMKFLRWLERLMTERAVHR